MNNYSQKLFCPPEGAALTDENVRKESPVDQKSAGPFVLCSGILRKGTTDAERVLPDRVVIP